MKRPNVLILYTDQQRWDTIAQGGFPLMHTPNIDALAKRGALFTNSFVNCPVCQPSRMSMLSGQYPAALGIRCNGTEMPEDITCVQHILKRYGYTTANIGKLHFRNHASAFRDHRDPHPHYGFDVMINSDEPGCYDDAYIKWVAEKDPSAVAACRCNTPPAWTGTPVEVHNRSAEHPYLFDGPEDLTHTAFVADETAQFIGRQAERGGPFFCVAGMYAPHPPINPPERFVRMYDSGDMPLPARNAGENYLSVTDEGWRKVKAYYYALVSHVDDQIGRVLRALAAHGAAEDTIVIFTSDHGEHLGDHGLIGKGAAYDSCARVPLVVSYPNGFSGGDHYDELVEAVDLVPSILDWCGVQQPAVMPGRSFRPLVEGKDYSPGESCLIELSNGIGSGYKAIRTLSHLYIHNADGCEELYDLSRDPDQVINCAVRPEHHDALAAARKEMIRRSFDSDLRLPRTAHY
jgi:arylsulfatase